MFPCNLVMQMYVCSLRCEISVMCVNILEIILPSVIHFFVFDLLNLMIEIFGTTHYNRVIYYMYSKHIFLHYLRKFRSKDPNVQKRGGQNFL